MRGMISAQTARRAVWRPLWELPRRFDLIWPLARRMTLARYRGSALGLLWAVLTPAVMIAVFTFLFAGVFGARFTPDGTPWDYALYLFCGLLPWTAFSETLQQSAGLVVAHANLVKRVVFPLEALPVAQALAALAAQLFGTLALLFATLVIRRELHATTLWLPVLLVPQLLLTLGGAWLVASLGVFIRDTAQVLGLLLMAWLYLTPIIYPEQIVPARFRPALELNPLTPLVRSYRRILLEGAQPDWAGLAYTAVVALAVFIFGYWWFARTRKNFADVI
ncbi:MAG: lipopolysaccharide transport system permease protein [Acidobacteriota bacterium]|jgi:lipopolysaccharide transport system permease protein|nr:lipopolysaccharide transport system permease protein [Acidobacteriota bacterium]